MIRIAWVLREFCVKHREEHRNRPPARSSMRNDSNDRSRSMKRFEGGGGAKEKQTRTVNLPPQYCRTKCFLILLLCPFFARFVLFTLVSFYMQRRDGRYIRENVPFISEIERTRRSLHAKGEGQSLINLWHRSCDSKSASGKLRARSVSRAYYYIRVCDFVMSLA